MLACLVGCLVGKKLGPVVRSSGQVSRMVRKLTIEFVCALLPSPRVPT